MATYTELFDLGSNTALRNRISIALVIKAQALLAVASPTANEVKWANSAITDPILLADKLMNYVLAANKAATTSQIISATDSAIQTNVDAAIDKLIAGGIVS